MTAPLLITFAEAEAIGQDMHDRFLAMDAAPPLPRDDMGWGDLVQFIMRRANDAAAARQRRIDAPADHYPEPPLPESGGILAPFSALGDDYPEPPLPDSQLANGGACT
jgi:hypothetical protein